MLLELMSLFLCFEVVLWIISHLFTGKVGRREELNANSERKVSRGHKIVREESCKYCHTFQFSFYNIVMMWGEAKPLLVTFPSVVKGVI